MYVLAIDTSSKFCSLAILQEEKILEEISFQSQNDLSSMLLPAIDQLLNRAECLLSQIELIGVSVGPGLFTGIRVGMATVKGLFFNRECPIVPVSTLTAWVVKCSDFSGHIVPVIDAKKNDVFWGIYKYEGGTIKEYIPAKLAPVLDFLVELKSWKNLRIAGTGMAAHREILEGSFPHASFYDTDLSLAASIGIHAHREYQEGRFIVDLLELKPNYLRDAIPG